MPLTVLLNKWWLGRPQLHRSINQHWTWQQYQQFLCSIVSATYQKMYHICLFATDISLSTVISSCIHFVTRFHSFYGWVLFRRIYRVYFLYSVMSWWSSGLISYLKYCELNWYKYVCTNSFLICGFHFLGIFPAVALWNYRLEFFRCLRNHHYGCTSLHSHQPLY